MSLEAKNAMKLLELPYTLYTLLTVEIIKWQKCARMGLNGFTSNV